MIQSATIHYRIKLTKGEVKGKIIELDILLGDLEEDNISTRLIDDGHYESMGHPFEYYDILDRTIEIHD